MIDVFCDNHICPICGSKMVVRDYFSSNNIDIFCNNKCYSVIYMGEKLREACFSIFSKAVGFFSRSDNLTDLIIQIEYWKENDRYLMEIMSR